VSEGDTLVAGDRPVLAGRVIRIDLLPPACWTPSLLHCVEGLDVAEVIWFI